MKANIKKVGITGCILMVVALLLWLIDVLTSSYGLGSGVAMLLGFPVGFFGTLAIMFAWE